MMNDNEDTVDENTQNYMFFRDPNIAEQKQSVATTQQTFSLHNSDTSDGQKNYTSLIYTQPQVQPYPFTFISAVKRKLALAAQYDSCKRISEKLLQYDDCKDKLKTTNVDPPPVVSLYEVAKNMEFIKPLKVPDLKISPKTSEFSPRMNSTVSRSSIQKGDKVNKISEKAYRKLDFAQGSSSLINQDDLKGLKTLDTSAAVPLTKKKEHSRDNSREKENRTKRIKKDDLGITRSDDSVQESVKRTKNLKHIPSKDIDESTKLNKNERLLTREFELVGGKSKNKNFLAKKEEERKLKPSSSHCIHKSLREKSLERKGRTYSSSESLSDRNIKIHDYVTARDSWAFEHNKKSIDKSKPSTSKLHNKLVGNTTEISENDIDIGSKASSIESNHSIYTELSQQAKKQSERISQSSQAQSDNLRYIDNYRRKDASTLSKNVTPSTDTKLDTTDSIDEFILNPRKISFRDDSYSHQEDFCNLVTPDLNLIYRPKRKKDQRPLQIVQEPQDNQDPSDAGNSEPALLHPTALHMQFQAELHLFDSYNESIRQVTDVENSLYNVKQDQEKEKLHMRKLSANQMKKQLMISSIDGSSNDDAVEINETDTGKVHTDTNFEIRRDDDVDKKKIVKSSVTVAEVQTQTANDIATQTETCLNRHKIDSRPKEFPGITYNRGNSFADMSQLSLGSFEEFKDLNRLDEISLPNKMRAMSEISLYETTSSIKTETGTEISISTRDVTCSFNKYLDLEMAQLIKDEKQMYDKIEMLFKSREKTLNDRSRKLVKLEEQKRALRDTGQDSRISSVKKKQRALLLKLQQEKEEMNRLKELHKLASHERRIMLQKQRNMLNPHMSTKNILTKLKRTADCQSPRRLSGPMKGYDIRSNSSISSLVDSDKSLLDKSQHLEAHREVSDSGSNKVRGKLDSSVEIRSSAPGNVGVMHCNYPSLIEESSNMENLQKYEVHARNFEEKMPKGTDMLRLKTHQMKLQTKLLQTHHATIPKLTSHDSQEAKSESDTLVEELSKKSKALRDRAEGIPDENVQKKKFDKSDSLKKLLYNNSEVKMCNKRKSTKNLKPKSVSHVLHENILRSKSNLNSADDSLKHNRRISDIEGTQSEDNCHDSVLEEISFNNSQNSLQALVKHSRTVKEKNYKLLRDIVNEHEAKENMVENQTDRDHNSSKDDRDHPNLGNISTRSQVSTFTISHHSSGDSEKSYSRSVVIRSQDHQFKSPKKLEQILHAREAAIASRRNCVEDWISWHTRLKAEESRVARMEEAAFKLVTATSSALSCHDTTGSSGTSDVEGRVELLAEKLTERRAELTKLKKEARRQGKQRLKALETNLLNQIKKYDMTIHEMRKKLEAKRNTSKDNGKLAIEAKSIADFKVPEIPIKRIQEIYKNNDLLRSRSESDLITNSEAKKSQYGIDYQSISSPGSKNGSLKSNQAEKIASRSIESVLEEIQSHSSGQIEYSPKSDNNSNIPSASSNSRIYTEVASNTKITNNDESIFSTKIDSLHLNNKNLSEDINTLENDLKTLSELMSRFSKKSSEKLGTVQTYSLSENEKSTSKDVSEELLKSDTIETVGKSETIGEILDSENYSKTVPSEITSTKQVLPEAKLSEEIDFEARSKEILNVIEKSIISDHIKLPGNNLDLTGAALEKSMQNLHKENEALSSDFNSLEGDIKSISEIISKMVESKRSLSVVTDISSQSFGQQAEIKLVSPEEEISIKSQSQIPTGNEEDEDKMYNNISLDTHTVPLKFIKSNTETISEDDKMSLGQISSRIDWTESPEKSFSEDKNIQKEIDYPEDFEPSIFSPTGESTNIHDIYALTELEDKAIDDTLNYQKIHTDELDDILDIIARETEETLQANRESGEVPEALQLELGNKSIVPPNNELNLTAEVEPVLQKLTEILQSVERNIAKRTLKKQATDEVLAINNKIVASSVLKIKEVGDKTNDQQVVHEEIFASMPIIPDKSKPGLKISEILKDPEYEDISEESIEVSEILDRSESHSSKYIPEKYEAIQKTDDVLRILDEISQKSLGKWDGTKSNEHLQDLEITIQVFESISPNNEVSPENVSGVIIEELDLLTENLKKVGEHAEKISDEKVEDVSSESSEDADTPKGVSEIDMDSPRDPNESRLDIEILDDDLLAENDIESNQKNVKLEFSHESTIATSEKDIEAMIDKLRASLEQPGLEVAELDARLLRLEQLQIELQIKKLEAEEVAFYVREIPNKPPPPYTPPGGGSRTSPETLPTLPPAVVPTNVEELTAFTEKATIIIYNAKRAGKDVMSLNAPLEICQLSKDDNEIAKKDRRIYNTFLFDLCKETIAEVYQSEYEKPGPSWTKPNIKTKPAIKIPKTVEELNDYVSKEVATLFGFKTKLQRENMVMRWSRKRRDRVDELLTREAQAEEDEWTKFHDDELAVKNELTVAILDTLVLETTNIIKSVYAKKRRIMA